MKKLIPALCMLLIVATLLGTSTYAWFSMNTTVTATGLEVTAKSNNVDLIIGLENDLETVQTDLKTEVEFTLTGDDVKVYPSAHETVANATDAADVSNWYYKEADVASASASTKDAHVLTAFTDYVLVYNMYITLAEGSNPAQNLTVSATIASNETSEEEAATFAAVRALVVTDSAAAELSPATASSSTVLAASVTDEALIPVTVYVYYDGNDSTVYTNNIANLDGATIDLEFRVSPADAPAEESAAD